MYNYYGIGILVVPCGVGCMYFINRGCDISILWCTLVIHLIVMKHSLCSVLKVLSRDCREEREWREWVDNKLIHVLAPNIYQTPSQSVKAFRYIGEVSNFNIFERYLAQCVGPFVMYFIAKKLRKKQVQHNIVVQSIHALL